MTTTHFHPQLSLQTWYPEGVLDGATVLLIVNYVGHLERTNDEPFHRYSDLSKVTAVQLDFVELTQLASARRDAAAGRPPVKSAFLGVNLAAYGIARMFATLMESSSIDVRVFRKIEDAAQWLGVPVEVLRADQEKR
jgi:hypothetical protein